MRKKRKKQNQRINSLKEDKKSLSPEKPKSDLVWLKRIDKRGKYNQYILSSSEYQEIELDTIFYDENNKKTKLTPFLSFLNKYCFLYAHIKIRNGKPVITEFIKDMLYRCPKDTRNLAEQYYNEIDNFNLKLNHFAQFKGDKFKFFGNKKLIAKPNFNQDLIQELISAIQQRQQKQKETLFPKKELYRELEFTPDWRLIIGLGQESVYETSITLHHIYGIPYIPASAIKGVTRNYYISEHFDGVEKQAMKDEQFCHIFGADDNSYDGAARQGQVFFFDAFPTQLNNDAIQPDVMNVHYPEYYGSGTKPPTDTQNPNPILFLTVENTPFQFIIGIKKAQENAERLLKTTTECLKNALEQHGIGAKTAVGYGFGSLDTV